MNTVEQVSVLRYRFNAHFEETNGFRWNFIDANYKEVVELKPVSQDTIDGLSGLIHSLSVPKNRAKLKRQISYLIALRHRQCEAWEEMMQDFETRTKNTIQWVQSHER